jgi:hypothetical protein
VLLHLLDRLIRVLHSVDARFTHEPDRDDPLASSY